MFILVGKIICLLLMGYFIPIIIGKIYSSQSVTRIYFALNAIGITGFVALQWLI